MSQSVIRRKPTCKEEKKREIELFARKPPSVTRETIGRLSWTTTVVERNLGEKLETVKIGRFTSGKEQGWTVTITS